MITFIFIATTITMVLHHRYTNKYIDEETQKEYDEFEDILNFLSDIKIKFDL
jgi:uncharacterized membrane protein